MSETSGRKVSNDVANTQRLRYDRQRLDTEYEVSTMVTAKEQIAELISRQPDDSSYDEIIRELAFELMVQRGLKDSDESRTISNEEMHRRIKTWQK